MSNYINIKDYTEMQQFAGTVVAYQIDNQKPVAAYTLNQANSNEDNIMYGTVSEISKNLLSGDNGYSITNFLEEEYYKHPVYTEKVFVDNYFPKRGLRVRKATTTEVNELASAKKIHHLNKNSLNWKKIKKISERFNELLFFFGQNDLPEDVVKYIIEIGKDLPFQEKSDDAMIEDDDVSCYCWF